MGYRFSIWRCPVCLVFPKRTAKIPRRNIHAEPLALAADSTTPCPRRWTSGPTNSQLNFKATEQYLENFQKFEKFQNLNQKWSVGVVVAFGTSLYFWKIDVFDNISQMFWHWIYVLLKCVAQWKKTKWHRNLYCYCCFITWY